MKIIETSETVLMNDKINIDDSNTFTFEMNKDDDFFSISFSGQILKANKYKLGLFIRLCEAISGNVQKIKDEILL